MKGKKILEAFTLVELLVAITVVTVIILGVSQMDFNRLSQRQKIDVELIEIISLIEEVRNNSLIGKWVWTSLQTPSDWRVTIENSTSSWSVLAQYNSGGLIPYSRWDSQSYYRISDIRCTNIWWSLSSSIWTGELLFEWSKIEIVSSCWLGAPEKIIEFDYGFDGYKKTVRINSLSGTIESF